MDGISDMNSSIEQPPCEGCLCLPMCKRKLFASLIQNCSLIENYLYEDSKSKFHERIYLVEGCLLPITWHPTTLEDKTIRIVEFSPDYHF
jgi:hypothetical protein